MLSSAKHRMSALERSIHLFRSRPTVFWPELRKSFALRAPVVTKRFGYWGLL
jgi:hypothetical protein